MQESQILLNREKKRFELEVEGHKAVLYYEEYEPDVWMLTHTLVPDPLKGKGLGSRLVKHVLQHCQDNNIRIIPECPFISSYIKRHPEWEKLLFSRE